ARFGKFGQGKYARRLAGRNLGRGRFGCARLWTNRIVTTRFHRSISHCCSDRGGRASNHPALNRRESFPADVATRAFSRPHIHWRELVDLSALRCPWRNFVFPASQFNSSAALLGHRGGRGALALHPDHFFSFALVRRTDRKLWSKASAHYRPVYPRVGFSVFHLSDCWSVLLDTFFFAAHGPRP